MKDSSKLKGIIPEMIPEYPTKVTRIGAILALMATLVWVQWPLDFNRLGVGQSITFLAALMTWIGIEWADWQNHYGYNINSLDEDATKVNYLIEILDRKTYYQLRYANVETYIRVDDYKGLEEFLAYYEADLFKFHNNSIQDSYDNVERLGRIFIHNLWSLYTSDGRGWATWRPRNDDWVEDEIFEKVMLKIAGLNRDATAVADAWEDFIKVAKSELRGNSVGLNFYKL
ncbi:MAG: hypothetical protein NXH91_02620 [Phyllobacteriaceae bacterium]|nr:hypothetical protein [Phyllobacteriaceae bacterium]